MKSSEKNRFQNAFTVCNMALDSVVLDMFGKSATAITDYLISEDTFNPEYCVSLSLHSLEKNADSVLESIEGGFIASEQKFRMLIVRSHLNCIENLIYNVNPAIDIMISNHEGLVYAAESATGARRNCHTSPESAHGTCPV